MDVFSNAKWIWNRQVSGEDCYSEFIVKHHFEKGDKVRLRISSDSNYAVYVNGVFADSGQYADMPHYKVYDEVDLSDYIVEGENYIAFIVWYYGMQSFTYYIGKPGVIFEIEKNDEVVNFSDETVLSRKSRKYISGRKEAITMMLGPNYHVDLKESDAWMVGEDTEGFEPSSVPEDMPTNLVPRISKKLKVLPLMSGSIVMQGSFSYPKDEYLTQHGGDRMQNSALSFFRLHEMADREEKPMTMVRKTGEGIFFIVDILQETAGYLEFDLEVPENCFMEVGWGEHLVDGRCRSAVGIRNDKGATHRNFSVSAQLKKGRNRYMNPMRRLGCRYIQFFIHTSEVTVHDAGIRPSVYPVTPKEYKSGNLLRDEIYKVCQNTLIQCMHEHYEDCPWREQSFYTGDSQNQMLCGYYTFGEYDLPKASLRLIAECIREDDLQGITFPTNVGLTIPSGIPMYAVMLEEYHRFSGDKETIKYCFSAVKRNLDVFIGRIDETGLIPNFEEYDGFWNFYEWKPYLTGKYYMGPENYDMCLNALLSEGLISFTKLCDIVGEDATSYREVQQKLNEKMVKTFYDEEEKLFRLSVGPSLPEMPFAVLPNVLACKCGAAEMVDRERILKVIETNGLSEPDLGIVPTTLYKTFDRFHVLMKEDKERYRETILDQIDRMCLKMMREGATSFWETEEGHKDFDYAGSLCHGWGAMPIIYYEELCGESDNKN